MDLGNGHKGLLWLVQSFHEHVGFTVVLLARSWMGVLGREQMSDGGFGKELRLMIQRAGNFSSRRDRAERCIKKRIPYQTSLVCFILIEFEKFTMALSEKVRREKKNVHGLAITQPSLQFFTLFSLLAFTVFTLLYLLTSYR